MLRAGLVSCIACLALLVLAACGGGSTSSGTATASVSTTTPTSTSVIASSPTPIASPAATATPTPTPSPSATPTTAATSRPATPSPTPTVDATPVASPGVGLVTGSPTPRPTDQVKAQLAKGVSSDYAPVDPATVFSTATPKIYLVFSTTDLPENSSLDTVWIAVKVDADVPADYEIDKAHLDVHGSQSGDFLLAAPGDGFPTGSYKVDLYLNGTLIGSYPYEVK